MLAIEPADSPLSFLAAKKVYRGISAQQLERLRATGAIAPQRALGSSAETITLCRSRLPIDHVLARKREHSVSFSLHPERAIWYATSGGAADGYLCEVALPKRVRAVIEGGSQPVAYSGDDGTEWIDPRHITVGAGLLEWSRFRSRSIVDQEILLVGGSVRPTHVLHVPRGRCDMRYAPWAMTGERIRVL